MPEFPGVRMRRLRASENLRRLSQENRISIDNLVYPLFIVEGHNRVEKIASMPGINRISVDQLPAEIEGISESGLPAVLLFGITDNKDDTGSGAYSGNGVIERAVKIIKQTNPGIVVITDVCLCEYTSHGHCGIVKNGVIDNDSTLHLLAEMALSHARAGADMLAPSDMMDGRVGVIRRSLDENGYPYLPIMAYSAKFASGFYGPFRDACSSCPSFGDRQTYQMNCANSREALREIEMDINEGADIVMVKPALSYLDVIQAAKSTFRVPLAAYNVSGEYSMVKFAAEKGLIDEKQVVNEILLSIKRAGADIIVTYHAKEIAGWQHLERNGSRH